MTFRHSLARVASCCLMAATLASSAVGDEPASYEQVAPILRTYCESCHNDQESEGEFSVSSYQRLMQGGSKGAAVVAADAELSRLWRLVTGKSEPSMPPEDSPRPNPEELALLGQWIASGAKGPDGAEPPRQLITPRIEGVDGPRSITAVAWSPDGGRIAAARFGRVELYAVDQLDQPQRVWSDLPGKVNRIRFSPDGQWLVAATGVAGLRGEARLLEVDGDQQRAFLGHRDSIYDAVISPNGRWLATGSYDHLITLWDVEQGTALRTLAGHNGAVFALSFHPQSEVLASASADQTIKVWRTEDGARLDTLSQPLQEQYSVAFRPDGEVVAGAGADNRIRVWRLVSLREAAINPLGVARFAHEAPIIRLAYSADGRRLASAASDRTVKVWDSPSMNEIGLLTIADAAISDIDLDHDGTRLVVGCLDGRLRVVAAPRAVDGGLADQPASPAAPSVADAFPPLIELSEVEPNDDISSAQVVPVPCTISGRIHAEEASSTADADAFRFSAQAGQTLMIEVNAARQKSPLDSHLMIVDDQGRPVPRVLLQAVRDSYFTFRGKDSRTIDDFRLQNWEEMDLNQFLYCNGEVVKLWMYPRGPDSGFKVYPGEGERHGFFDTTPLSHPLNETCYVVEPRRSGDSLIPNGLPVFPIYFENDDDSLRRWGADSRLTFTAPADGDYGVRLTDVRGFQGADFHYALTIRPARPDFEVAVEGLNPKIPAGSGREFSIRADRRDGYDGPIRVEIENVARGLTIPSPIVIEAGQLRSFGQVRAEEGVQAWSADELAAIHMVAVAELDGQSVRREIPNPFAKLELVAAPQVRIEVRATRPSSVDAAVETTDTESQPAKEPAINLAAEAASEGAVEAAVEEAAEEPPRPLTLVIRPGQTISARIRLQRSEGFLGEVSFGLEGAGRNLPHGAIVDNIGLNGLLLLGGQVEREFFLTAAPTTRVGEYWFHLKAEVEGGLTSPPMMLRVVQP